MVVPCGILLLGMRRVMGGRVGASQPLDVAPGVTLASEAILTLRVVAHLVRS